MVGVNRFATDEPPTVEVFALDPDVERQQVARVQALRAARDARRAGGRRSTRSSAAARARDNLVPPIIAAVEAQATVGEIADTHARRVRRVPRGRVD